MSIIDERYDEAGEFIAAGKKGYARAIMGGQKIVLHPQPFGSENDSLTVTGNLQGQPRSIDDIKEDVCNLVRLRNGQAEASAGFCD